MRCLQYFLNTGPLLVLLSLTAIPSAQSIAYPAISPRTTDSIPIKIPESLHKTRWPWSRLRESVVSFIWNVPSEQLLKTANAQASISTSNPPSSLLARYGGDLVLRFEIKSAAEATALAEAINVLFLDVWEFTSQWVDIRLSKDVVRLVNSFQPNSPLIHLIFQVPSLLGLLPASLQHAHTPLMHDLAQAIFESYPSATFEEPSPQIQNRYRTFSPDLHPSTDETNIFFRNYQPLSVIVPWMRLLSSLFPTHVRMINIGVSYEGRDIPALRVGVHPTNSEKPTEPRKTIIITGGSHAREWISTSSVNYVAYSFITAYGKSQPMTKLLEKFDWIFIPTLNPDGYVYTWESDRLWRKNRQQTTLRFCKGVDLDRAYSFEWDASSSKNNPCSESFSGEGPFQAVESRRFANWVLNETEHNHAEIVAFLDFHSYSQQVLYPYSFSCTSAPPSLENLEELAIGLAKAIRLTNGHNYGVAAACEGSVSVWNGMEKQKKAANGNKNPSEIWPRMETGGGSALDWFYQELHVRYSYQIKLFDTGSYGFLLPSKNIVPIGKEAFNAVQYLGKFLLGNKGIEMREDDTTVEDNAKEKEREKSPSVDSGVSEVVQKKDEEDENDGYNWELRRRRR